MRMKGIVLAGGTGTRLWPVTKSVSKQLLPVFDKPLIYYPIATLMQAGIREILIITTPHDQRHFHQLLGDGSQFGVQFSYTVQSEPRGLAEAFIVGESFIGAEAVAMVLGDNIFSGFSFSELGVGGFTNGAHIFTYAVSNPSAYGVLTFKVDGKIESIEEKPLVAKSNLAITGLYFFDSSVCARAKKLQPSARGELEIVDLIKSYMESQLLSVTNLPTGSAWLDTGTPEGLHDASSYVRVIEERTAVKIGCLEEIAFKNSWIDKATLENSITSLGKNSYVTYLQKLLEVGR
jgi:glucose-1-phosphate thymidylyltransferase